eukprot:gene9155-biopygen9237
MANLRVSGNGNFRADVESEWYSDGTPLVRPPPPRGPGAGGGIPGRCDRDSVGGWLWQAPFAPYPPPVPRHLAPVPHVHNLRMRTGGVHTLGEGHPRNGCALKTVATLRRVSHRERRENSRLAGVKLEGNRENAAP